MVNTVKLDVVDFQKEMKRVEQEVKRLANDDIESKIDYATKTLREVTPVDSGVARAGWKNQKTKNSNELVEAKIINDVEYISILNNGHSKQAPKYFIEQVLITIGILTPN
jgi:hypothetical protein